MFVIFYKKRSEGVFVLVLPSYYRNMICNSLPRLFLVGAIMLLAVVHYYKSLLIDFDEAPIDWFQLSRYYYVF